MAMTTHFRNFAIACITLALASFASSCEKYIDADIPYGDPYLSATCTFTPDSTWSVVVGKSVHILDDAGPSLITDAVVEIYEEGVLLETLTFGTSPFSSAMYRGTTKPSAGKTYSLKVAVPGYEPVTATSSVPATVPAITTSYRDSVLTDGFGGYTDEVKVSFLDPAGEKNYYGIVFGFPDTIDTGLGDTITYWSTYYTYGNDNGITEQDFTGTHILSDEIFDGKQVELTFSIDSWVKASGEKLYVFLSNMTEEHYKFMVTNNAYQQVNGNPFAEPVLIHNNLTGGYGIFAGFNVAKTQIY
jgi:hypothetical protein